MQRTTRRVFHFNVYVMLQNGTEESVSCLDEASIYLGRWVCWSPGEKLIVSRLANRDLSDEVCYAR
jgi:hypothetical protein